jgi:nucleotide-binding universal stress UspA family protein
MKTFQRILFPTDFSPIADHAFDYALGLARTFGARLFILHVINEQADLRGFYLPHLAYEQVEADIAAEARRMMATFCAGIEGYENHEGTVVSGVPHDEILTAARDRDADLIVLGTHGWAGVEHLLFGSTAERVVRHAHCPVMTVRPDTK